MSEALEGIIAASHANRQAVAADRRERHARWKIENTAKLDEAGIAYRAANNGECLCIRESDGPLVDFYPSTGRWRRILRGNRRASSQVMRGGWKQFLPWFAAEKVRMRKEAEHGGATAAAN